MGESRDPLPQVGDLGRRREFDARCIARTTAVIPVANARREDAAAETPALRELSAAIGGRTRAPTQQSIIATLVLIGRRASVGTAATRDTIPLHRRVWLTASTSPENQFAGSAHGPRRQPSRALGQS